MSTQAWAFFGVAISAPFLPLFLREYASRRAIAGLTKTADGLWNEATERGQEDDERVRRWHDSIVVLSAVAPHVAGGLMDLSLSSFPSFGMQSNDTALALEGVEWVVPYLFAGMANIGILEFYGFPYKVSRWPMVIVYAGFLLIRDAHGAVRFSPAGPSASSTVRRVARATDRVESYGSRYVAC